jgi:pyruvate/2-oxoglutarate dehydrogenase complex dihydrolipoamide acyltransferase (E2) component
LGDHPEDLDDGRVLEPGDYIELDAENRKGIRAKTLIEDGKLVDLSKMDRQAPEVTDAALKLARKEQVDLTAVRGTGKDGSVTVGDVEQHIEKREGGAK